MKATKKHLAREYGKPKGLTSDALAAVKATARDPEGPPRQPPEPVCQADRQAGGPQVLRVVGDLDLRLAGGLAPGPRPGWP